MRYRAIYNTQASITVFVDVPDSVDPLDADDWVADESRAVASEHIDTWGTHAPVLLDMSLDGIGADEVEPA